MFSPFIIYYSWGFSAISFPHTYCVNVCDDLMCYRFYSFRMWQLIVEEIMCYACNSKLMCDQVNLHWISDLFSKFLHLFGFTITLPPWNELFYLRRSTWHVDIKNIFNNFFPSCLGPLWTYSCSYFLFPMQNFTLLDLSPFCLTGGVPIVGFTDTVEASMKPWLDEHLYMI